MSRIRQKRKEGKKAENVVRPTLRVIDAIRELVRFRREEATIFEARIAAALDPTTASALTRHR